MEGLAGTTVWNKLAGDLAPTFLFALSCGPERGLAVPFLPGLREHWVGPRAEAAPGRGDYTVTRAETYERASSGELGRPLAGVAVYTGVPSAVGGGWRLARADSKANVVEFVPGGRAGQVVFRQAPLWLAGDTTPRPSVSRGTLTAPPPQGVRAPLTAPKPASAAPAAVPAAVSMRAYAESVYAYERLRHRAGQLVGPVRLDVAPGSAVKIEGFSGGGADDALATASRVTVQLDVNSQAAYTTFGLEHLRPVGGDSADRHPLYAGEGWPGAELQTSA